MNNLTEIVKTICITEALIQQLRTIIEEEKSKCFYNKLMNGKKILEDKPDSKMKSEQLDYIKKVMDDFGFKTEKYRVRIEKLEKYLKILEEEFLKY